MDTDVDFRIIPSGRVLAVAGLILMVVGAVDPLEGAMVILPGAGMVVLWARLSNSRLRTILYAAFAMIAMGVGAMWVLSAFGGIGGNSGRSLAWGLFILPYPVGWIMGVVSGIGMLFEHPHDTGGLQAD